jgi:hypothetical protein
MSTLESTLGDFLTHHQPHTLLMMKADNVGLEGNGLLHAVMNSGHRKRGSIMRLTPGEPKRYPT